MKFLKALRKSDGGTPPFEVEPSEVVPQAEGKFSHLVPGLVSDASIKIGRNPKASDLAENSVDLAVALGVGQTPISAELGSPTVESFPNVFVDEVDVNRHLVAITEPASAFCEEYRNLRTTLLQKSKKQKLKTIAVVSTVPSEGKSITALNLAWLLAQTDGISALVIDSDLRLPSLTKYLGIEAQHGLSDVLDGGARFEDTIIRLQPSGLHLLPGGGGVRSDVAEQFSGPTFANLLGRAQEMFDFIILDAPPLSVFADAKVLMNQADTSILVVRSNYTKFKDIDRILEGLSGQRILGVVLNRSEETLIGGKYYDYPYYQNYESKVGK
jgi:capsular exopolysaccharide synthesis family protein